MAGESDLNCDDCSACCMQVGNPPFLLELVGGVPRLIPGDDSLADYDRLFAAPAEAQAAFRARFGKINAVCPWLDEASQRCRHYEFRPDLCRSFEVGGKWCLRHRELRQIEEAG